MAKIMLVEDDNNLREIYGARLLAEGHQIVAAKDGEEALALAVKEKPDLIISDVMMPRISGFDMLDILRNAPETKYTKVIMMTALSQAEDKARADKLGADRYLVKSQVTLEDVAQVVRDVLAENGTTASAPTAPAPAVPADPAVAPVASPTSPASDTAQAVSPPAPAPVSVAPEPSVPAPAPPAVAPAPTVPNNVPVTPITPPTDTTPAESPTDTAPTPTKIEVVEAPTVGPSAQTPGPTAPKVVLPTPPDEKPMEADKKPEEPSVPTPEVSAPTVGPNLTEALAQEETEGGQNSDNVAAPGTTGDVTNASVESEQKQEEPAIPAPEVKEESQKPSNPLEEEQASHKKVISPINDLTKKPDLTALLAAEEKKPAVENPGVSSVITPSTPDNQNTSEPAKPGAIDPHSSIAL